MIRLSTVAESNTGPGGRRDHPPVPLGQGVNRYNEPIMNTDPHVAGAQTPPRPAWNRATGVLLGLVAALVMVYGLLFLVSAGRGQQAEENGDVQQISYEGESVDINRHLAAGKYTVIDFYADWCPPCQELNPYLENVARNSDAFAVRKINILHWGTPVVSQYDVQRFGLPYLRMYDPDGTMIAEGLDTVLEEIRARF